MREIIFRGKSKESGEWVYGSLIGLNQGEFICDTNHYNTVKIDLHELLECNALWEHNDFVEVLPETVGQYTGLIDINRNKIFEGDIIEFDGDRKRDTVIWGDGEYNGVSGFRLKRHALFSITASNHDLVGVIGNIHDNPDLLTR